MTKFNNTQNKCIKVDEQEYWISRSVAIVGILIFKNIDTDKNYVLLEKRSEKMDQPNKYCLPCGYIDWDENGWECLIREVFEETTFYIPEHEDYLISNNDKQPFFVNTDPSENRQNIALRYGLVFYFHENEFPYEISKHSNDEVTSIEFVLLEDVEKYDMAFQHDKVIKLFTEKKKLR